MNHQISMDDQEFQRRFESFAVTPEAFDHAAHVRLAYIYLCEHSVAAATENMKKSLLAFLAHIGVGEAKYHETITRAWILAVNHFMGCSVSCDSSAAFMNRYPELLDSKIMLTHYSAEVLFASKARWVFIEPDIEAIPGPEVRRVQ